MTTALILAAGRGTRARSDIPKQLVKVAGRALVAHSVAAFSEHPAVTRVIVVHTPDMGAEFAEALAGFDVKLVEGAETRNSSTLAGLAHVKTDLVLIHDAVRPLVSRATIDRVLAALGAGHVAVDTIAASTDTLVTHAGGTVTSFPNRTSVWRGQTPQGFHTHTLRAAYSKAGKFFSDDCQVTYHAGFPVHAVLGDETNIKVTHPGDFAVADRLFQARRTTPAGEPFSGRVVVVGGTSGIGAAVVTATNGIALGTSTGFDVTNPDSTPFEGADAVVITAGVLHAGPLAEQSDEDIDDMLMVNLAGTIRTAKAAAKHLAATRGHLVLCSSSSYTRGRGNLAVYSATKAAIVALTQALAEEWPEVRVNCICPERTDTPMRRAAFGDEPEGSLMSATDAAAQVVAMLGTPLTGQVFDLRRDAA